MIDYEKLINIALKCAEDGDISALTDALGLCRELEKVNVMYVDNEELLDPDSFASAHFFIKRVIAASAHALTTGHADSMTEQTYRDALKFDAPYDFDAALIFAEFDRPYPRKFYEPRRPQLLPIVRAMQDLADNKLDLLCISTPPGIGKALANNTPVLTKNGWKKHGDLMVGDEVIGIDGKFKKIVAVHPKCDMDVLVEFTNGDKIQCHENHEWLIHDRANKKDYIAETKQLEKRKLNSGGPVGKRGHRYVFQIPKKAYIDGEEKSLIFDPYTLGVWLGDGANKNPVIANAICDKAIIDRIVENGIEIRNMSIHKITGVYYYGFDIRAQLQKYNMCHSRKIKPKHIPEEYLTASKKQRLDLLAGLIDTDGTLAGSKYTFTTCETPLRDTFIDLLSTFGWRASVATHAARVSSSGVVGKKDTYCVSFTPDCFIPCALERKQNKSPHKQRKIAIKSIKRVPPVQGNCITVEGDGMYLAGRTMIPTHNTTLAIMYIVWEALKHPELTTLCGSHSNSFLRGVYDEVLRMLEPGGEYLWSEIFPTTHIVNTNARDMQIDLGRRKRFPTIETGSIGSGNAGRIRASGLLYCDDLIPDIETAMSKDRLDKLYQQYYTDLRQRKQGGAKELHIATRWSIYDVIGRLEAQYEDSKRAKFIRFAALDENDESNFDYPFHLGFTTEFYRQQRDIMDDASWRALYLNEPVEREGLLIGAEELRRYFELPPGEPDAVIAVCDTKDQGTDYCVMPVAYRYGQDYYIDAFICDNNTPDVVEERLVDTLVERRVAMCRFESNRAGGRVAQSVQKAVHERGGITNITTKWNQTNKETRIIVASGWIKTHCLFKDESLYKTDREYRTAMTMLTSYTLAGKNRHDDVPDAMSMLMDFAESFESQKVVLMKRPF